MTYCVYIIRSESTGQYYTGITNNIGRRLKEHNRKKSNTVGTRNLTDFRLIYTETVKDRIEARKREKYLKSGIGRGWRNKMVSANTRV